MYGSGKGPGPIVKKGPHLLGTRIGRAGTEKAIAISGSMRRPLPFPRMRAGLHIPLFAKIIDDVAGISADILVLHPATAFVALPG